MPSNNYPWYQLVSSQTEDITQGDIIENIDVISATLSEENNHELSAEITAVNGIILTQACDIKQGKAQNIILCPIITKGEYETKLKECGVSENKIKSDLGNIRTGRKPDWCAINKPDFIDYQNSELDDILFINFNDTYAVPIEYVRKVVANSTRRLRLLPPYREHLGQAYARYFMRVGLPLDLNF